MANGATRKRKRDTRSEATKLAEDTAAKRATRNAAHDADGEKAAAGARAARALAAPAPPPGHDGGAGPGAGGATQNTEPVTAAVAGSGGRRTRSTSRREPQQVRYAPSPHLARCSGRRPHCGTGPGRASTRRA